MTAALGLSATTACAAGWSLEQLGAMDGAAELLHAEETCGMRLDAKALNLWLESKNVLSPDALSRINFNLDTLKRSNKTLTENQCALAKASAKSIGALVE
ncbi:hypothetical protein NBH19_08825 [Rhizobium sp. S95]|uniref:Uncharacterized protein n=1 Tax=Ciceribacter sichuanensis TaxID=2949647 RepID=A0AAJ1BWQ5_9HYPH|nr:MULTISPECIES: hypothetical protein [unclassified Ciceribacter]MCM2396180.1 hypothetical protein [Ciceribacter sp. S95]MCO5957669.1 hypothetical protein [Ciceribacter sp. S101]